MSAEGKNIVMAAKQVEPVLPVATLDALAQRFRPAGLFMLMLNTEGAVSFHDPAASMFFQRFALPMLQSDSALLSQIKSIKATDGATTCNILPGVTLATFPFVEKKKVNGILALCARSESFKLNEDVMRVCSKFGIDGVWLAQQADELPTYGDEAMLRQSRHLLSMVRDQTKMIGMEKELDSLSGQLSNSYEELSLIYQLSSGMKVNRRADDFFKQVCQDVMEVMNVRGMGASLRSGLLQDHGPMMFGATSLPTGTVQRLSDELIVALGERKTPLLIHHLSDDKRFGWLGEHAQQLLAVPLSRQDQVLGCLFAIDKKVGEFDSVDSKLLNSIANESAIYLENAMLFEDVHGLMMGLLHSLTSAVDAKDAYTCGHSERVALLSRMLAQEAGYPEARVERIYMAGLLHDVGKIGVPEAVLQKTGRLTPEEFEQIKKHPEIGARILRDVKQIEDVIPGVMHHHERYDGKGYPSGLAGENIPLFGRLICLADCFDAMTSSRTYRKALPLEVALTEIQRCSGTQFDPGLTDHFLKIGESRLRELLQNHHEQAKRLIDLQQTTRTVTPDAA